MAERRGCKTTSLECLSSVEISAFRVVEEERGRDWRFGPSSSGGDSERQRDGRRDGSLPLSRSCSRIGMLSSNSHLPCIGETLAAPFLLICGRSEVDVGCQQPSRQCKYGQVQRSTTISCIFDASCVSTRRAALLLLKTHFFSLPTRNNAYDWYSHSALKVPQHGLR